MKGVPAVRKALCVAVLVVLAWTSMAAGQNVSPSESQARNVMDFTTYLLLMERRTDEKDVAAFNGHDWVTVTENFKVGYVEGFITAAYLTGRYAMHCVGSYPRSETADLRVATWGADSIVGLAKASEFRFRVGVYMLELDVLYEDYANRDIPVLEAMYIVNERLNGRSVNIEEWRKKGQQKL